MKIDKNHGWLWNQLHDPASVLSGALAAVTVALLFILVKIVHIEKAADGGDASISRWLMVGAVLIVLDLGLTAALKNQMDE